ncbi:MAG: twin-arginine translocase TatA/TatE family subunit [Bacteroidales bacterium]|nr:twin-arginine translocase TatA/TatE family subunit [Bacteroidales bacterium]MBR0304206.1 twin-arginine translocase TatA/TatE family subunit [Bacteroidales bacterium]
MAIPLLFIGTTELLLIGGIALLIFGGKKLPELMKGLGQGVQSFKKGMSEPVPDNPDQNADEHGEEKEDEQSGGGEADGPSTERAQ